MSVKTKEMQETHTTRSNSKSKKTRQKMRNKGTYTDDSIHHGPQ